MSRSERSEATSTESSSPTSTCPLVRFLLSCLSSSSNLRAPTSLVADLNPTEEVIVEDFVIHARRYPVYDDYAVQHEILFPLEPPLPHEIDTHGERVIMHDVEDH